MRVVNLILAGCVVALSFVIYEQKYISRDMRDRAVEMRQAINAERDAVAILRAEWSHLNSPKRIERLARKHLGLKPLKAEQILTVRQYAKIRRSSPAEVAARMLGHVASSASKRRVALR